MQPVFVVVSSKKIHRAYRFNVTSGLAFVPLPSVPIYCATKGIEMHCHSASECVLRTSHEHKKQIMPSVSTLTPASCRSCDALLHHLSPPANGRKGHQGCPHILIPPPQGQKPFPPYQTPNPYTLTCIKVVAICPPAVQTELGGIPGSHSFGAFVFPCTFTHLRSPPTAPTGTPLAEYTAATMEGILLAMKRLPTGFLLTQAEQAGRSSKACSRVCCLPCNPLCSAACERKLWSLYFHMNERISIQDLSLCYS
jgi:hypothetical protein